MRHSRVINHLGRTSSHRKSMLANMAASLILHKRISTTTAKAKALKTYVEPLITKSKEDSTHSRRVVFSYLKDKTAVAELFRDVSPKIGERPGGYTRILKTGHRIGDNADMCILELVDYNEAMAGGEATKTKTTRRRKTSKKKDEVAGEAKTPKAAKGKALKADEPVAKSKEAATEAAPEE
jgi:large subunit ribosomal protein L17